MKLFDELQDRNRFFLPSLLAFVTIVTRIPFTSKLLYHMDSIQFALALEHFDVTVHQPHPPGYFLYVMLGRLVNSFIHDPNISFIAISILFSALTVVVVYYLGKEIFERKAALIAALFAITSPNLWFHGEVALSYTVEAFFSAFIAFLCWKIYCGKGSYIWLLAVTVAIAGGVRQNTPVFLLPLILFSIRKLPLRKVFAAIGLFTISCLIWFLPMTRMTGGFDVYIKALRVLWASTAEHKTVFDQGWPALSFHSFISFNFITFGIGGGIVLLAFCLYYLIRNKKLRDLDLNEVLFFSLWITPSFLFFLLIAIHPSVPGHVIIILPPLLLLTAATAVYLSTELKGVFQFASLGVLTIFVIASNLYLFFCLDSVVSYPSIRKHDRCLSSIIERLKTFDPATTTLFLTQNNMYWGLSHAIYYLPEYTVYDPKVINHPITEDRKIWSGYNRMTFLTDRIILSPKKKFFATLLAADETEKLSGNGMYKVDQLFLGIYMAHGPIACLQEIYPDMKIYQALQD